MRQIAAGLFISLDGVVEAPEKWTGPYFNDEVGQAVAYFRDQSCFVEDSSSDKCVPALGR